MKRLPAYLLAAMMLPMLGVWNAAEAVPKEVMCPNEVVFSIQQNTKKPSRYTTYSRTLTHKTLNKFLYARIESRRSRLLCAYEWPGEGKITVKHPGRCAQGPGFVASSTGIKCTKPRLQCKAICGR